MKDRILRINEKVKEDIALIFKRELSLKLGVLATISRVDTTRDMRYTRVFVSVFPADESEYLLATLAHERRRLERLLHSKLMTKIKPAVSFHLDTTEVAAGEVEHILKTIEKERDSQ